MWNNVQACLDSAMEFIASPSQVEKVKRKALEEHLESLKKASGIL